MGREDQRTHVALVLCLNQRKYKIIINQNDNSYGSNTQTPTRATIADHNIRLKYYILKPKHIKNAIFLTSIGSWYSSYLQHSTTYSDPREANPREIYEGAAVS